MEGLIEENNHNLHLFADILCTCVIESNKKSWQSNLLLPCKKDFHVFRAPQCVIVCYASSGSGSNLFKCCGKQNNKFRSTKKLFVTILSDVKVLIAITKI